MVFTPAPVEDRGQVLVEVHPACCPNQKIAIPIAVYPGTAIPVTRGGGPNDALFAAFDRVIEDYMWDRCVGALSVAVQKDGIEVYRAAYGRTRGQPMPQVNAAWASRCKDAPDPAGRNLRPEDPIRVGSNTKVLLAAMVRWAVRRKWREKTGIFGPPETPTDEQIEAIPLCGNDMFDPHELLPPRLSDILCGLEPLVSAVPPPDTLPPSNCETTGGGSQPCKNGGTCVSGDYNRTHCICPAGFSGRRCQIRDDMWTGTPYADPRWQQVTLGDLMAHRSGLPQTARSPYVLSILDKLREWDGLDGPRADQAALWFYGPGDAVGASPALHTVRNVVKASHREQFFVRRPDLEEVFVATAHYALVSNPGMRYEYVNGNFSIQHLVIERLTGLPFARQADRPVGGTTALELFLEEELGIVGGKGSTYGIFPGNGFEGVVQEERIRYRQWSSNQNTWYPLEKDKKVPDLTCVEVFWAPFPAWIGKLSCSPQKWVTAGFQRFAWGDLGPGASPRGVPVEHHGMAISPGQGGMAVELPLWLEVMGRYRVFTTRGTPVKPYARPRDETNSISHSGLVPAYAASYELQTGSNAATDAGDDCSVDSCPEGEQCRHVVDPATLEVTQRCFVKNKGIGYSLPLPDPQDGRIPLDVPASSEVLWKCPMPGGVDAIVAVGQARDVDPAGLAAADDLRPYTGGRLNDHLKHALCTVDWDEVVLPFPIQLP